MINKWPKRVCLNVNLLMKIPYVENSFAFQLLGDPKGVDMNSVEYYLMVVFYINHWSENLCLNVDWLMKITSVIIVSPVNILMIQREYIWIMSKNVEGYFDQSINDGKGAFDHW